MHRFLAEWDGAKPKDAMPITAGALGVAGPLEGNTVKMTNRPWSIDGDRIALRCGIPRMRVMNDLAASAAGIDALTAEEKVTLQPGDAKTGEPRVVIGVGTGLGVAYLVSNGGRSMVVPGEAGHAGFAPETPEQAELWRSLFSAHGRVEVEDVVSGRGLANVYEFVARRDVGAHHKGVDPAWISENALSGRDAHCATALELFAECLGNVAGNHALGVMARG